MSNIGQRHLPRHQYRLNKNADVEAAVARWGSPYKAAEQTGFSEEQCLAAWGRMQKAVAS